MSPKVPLGAFSLFYAHGIESQAPSQYPAHEKAIRKLHKLALFRCLYENDTKAQSAFRYDSARWPSLPVTVQLDLAPLAGPFTASRFALSVSLRALRARIRSGRPHDPTFFEVVVSVCTPGAPRAGCGSGHRLQRSRAGPGDAGADRLPAAGRRQCSIRGR